MALRGVGVVLVVSGCDAQFTTQATSNAAAEQRADHYTFPACSTPASARPGIIRSHMAAVSFALTQSARWTLPWES